MNRSAKISTLAVFQLVGVVAVIAAGLGVFKLLSSMRKAPVHKERPFVAPLVEAMEVHSEDMRMEVEGFGTAQPKVTVQIVPQVAGEVVAVHPDFVEGGFFKAGEAVIKIDGRDYELAVENASAAVAQAQYMLQQEQAEAAVALKEWQLLNPGKEPDSPLVLREPQIINAQAQLQAAQARLATAKLNLERTTISLPFDGRVVSKKVDIGQYITPGQPVATVYGTDVIEIAVPLEDGELAWFDAPLGQTNGNIQGSSAPEAVVTADFAGSARTWNGTIVRTQGQIDPASRMVNVVAEVREPFKNTSDNVPLTPGMFVRVRIQGRLLKGVFEVPRYAVRDNDTVWAAKDGSLRIQQVKVVRWGKTSAYISTGLENGDVVITSPIDVISDGMKIRTKLDESSPAEQENAG
jgi:RND family efflux transporter MFP subunit